MASALKTHWGIFLLASIWEHENKWPFWRKAKVAVDKSNGKEERPCWLFWYFPINKLEGKKKTKQQQQQKEIEGGHSAAKYCCKVRNF